MSDPQQPPQGNPTPPAGQTPTTPLAADQQPTAQQPTEPAARPTTPMATPAPGTVQPPAAAAAGPAPEQAAQPAAGHATSEPSTAAQPAPGGSQPGVPHPDNNPPPAPGQDSTVSGIVKHRATQLVAVGLLGLVLGGGIVAIADRNDHRYGVGFDRSGHSRFDERGPERRSERGPERAPKRDFER